MPIALSEEELERYSRQMLLDGWGIEKQLELKSKMVFAAGAGGSGSVVITEMALIGVGKLRICDSDTVELSNLNRQFIHCMASDSRIGMSKALSAEKTVKAINPNVVVEAVQERIDSDNVDDLVGDADIILDGVDDFRTKFVLSACAVRKGIPHLTWGQMDINSFAGIFFPPNVPCLHCLFDVHKARQVAWLERLKSSGAVKTALPVMSPPVMASTSFALTEAVKLLLGIGEPAFNRLFLFLQKGSAAIGSTKGFQLWRFWVGKHLLKLASDQGLPLGAECWNDRFVEEIKVTPDPTCPVCAKPNAQETSPP